MNRNLLKLLFILCVISLNSQVYASSEYYDNTDYNNHPQIVDLGLSICWADRNVGANSPEEPGGRYYFSDVVCIGNDYTENPNSELIEQKNINSGFEIRGTKYDVARVKWGGAWRLPTPQEIKELLDSCSITYNSNGATLTGPNGNSIFLPLPKEYHNIKYSSDCKTRVSFNCCLEYGYGLYLSYLYDYDKLFVRPVINKAPDGSIINDYPNPSEDSYNTKLTDEESVIDNIEYRRAFTDYRYDFAEVKISTVKINDTRLKSFKIPQRVYINNRWENIINVEPDAFISCPNIETFELDNEHIQCIDGVLYNSTKTKILAIAPGKKGTLKIENGVESLEDICDNINDSKYKIDKIIIPASLKSFNQEYYGDFHGLNKFQKLTCFEVDKDNPYYCSIDGVLFSKDKTDLICYPPSKADVEYTIPTFVQSVSNYSFNNNDYLKKITISENVSLIHEVAFSDCKNLTEVISLPLNPPTCEVFNHRGATLYVYSDALDAYEDEWGEFNWSKIEVLDPMPIFTKILIALGCLIALGLIGFLGYKYLLPYIRQKQEESEIKREEKNQQEQKLKQGQLKINNKMERDTNYSPTENRKWMKLTSISAILALAPAVIFATLSYIFDSNFFAENAKILFIIQFISCGAMLIGLINAKKQYENYDNIKAFNHLLIATTLMTIVHLFIVFPDLLFGILGSITRNMHYSDYDDFMTVVTYSAFIFIFLVNYFMYLGIKKLTENSYVFNFKYTALSYLLIGIIPSAFALFLNMMLNSYKNGNPLNAFNRIEDDFNFARFVSVILIIAFVGCFIVACIGWGKAYKDADNNPEGLEDDSNDFALSENVAVEADPQLMADMEQKSDDELLSIINSPNLYAPTAVMTASNVYTIRNQESIMVELQSKSLVELQGIVTNQHAYCEAYIDIAKAVLSHKLS